MKDQENKVRPQILDEADMKGIYANSLSTMNAPTEFCEDMKNLTVYKKSYQSRPACSLLAGVMYDTEINDNMINDVILAFTPIIDTSSTTTNDLLPEEMMIFCTSTRIFFYRVEVINFQKLPKVSLVELRDYFDHVVPEYNSGYSIGIENNKPSFVRNSINSTNIIITGLGRFIEITFEANVPKAKLTRYLADLPTPDGSPTTSQITVFRVNCGCEVAGGLLFGCLYGCKGDFTTQIPPIKEDLYLPSCFMMFRIDYISYNPTAIPKILIQYFDIACIGEITAVQLFETGALATTTEQLWYLERSEDFKLGYIPQEIRRDIVCPFSTDLKTIQRGAGFFFGSNIVFATISSFVGETTDLPDYENLYSNYLTGDYTSQPSPYIRNYRRKNLIGNFYPAKDTLFFYRLNKDLIERIMSIDYGVTAYGYHTLYHPFDPNIELKVFCVSTYIKNFTEKGIVFGSTPVFYGTRKMFGLYLQDTNYNYIDGRILIEQMKISRLSVKISPPKNSQATTFHLMAFYINIKAIGVVKDSFKITAFAYDQNHNKVSSFVIKDLSNCIDEFGNIPEKFLKQEIKFQGKYAFFQVLVEIQATSCVISRMKYKVLPSDL